MLAVIGGILFMGMLGIVGLAGIYYTWERQGIHGIIKILIIIAQFPILLSLITSMFNNMIYTLKNPKAGMFDGIYMDGFISYLKIFAILSVLQVINMSIMHRRMRKDNKEGEDKKKVNLDK